MSLIHPQATSSRLSLHYTRILGTFAFNPLRFCCNLPLISLWELRWQAISRSRSIEFMAFLHKLGVFPSSQAAPLSAHFSLRTLSGHPCLNFSDLSLLRTRGSYLSNHKSHIRDFHHPIPSQQQQSRAHAHATMHLLHIAVTIHSELWGSGVDSHCWDISNLLVCAAEAVCSSKFMQSVSLNHSLTRAPFIIGEGLRSRKCSETTQLYIKSSQIAVSLSEEC